VKYLRQGLIAGHLIWNLLQRDHSVFDYLLVIFSQIISFDLSVSLRQAVGQASRYVTLPSVLSCDLTSDPELKGAQYLSTRCNIHTVLSQIILFCKMNWEEWIKNW
jgi:hypothetical protein